MSEDTQLLLKQLQNAYRDMPYNQRRLAVTLEALALAEQLDAPTRATVLYDLAWAYAMGDDPAKALPICAEFLALLEECPGYRNIHTEAPSAAMIAAYVARSLPQISAEQCAALLEEFHRQVKKFGVGERLWLTHACAFSIDQGDTKAAEAHLQAFYRTKRDAISDCRACETSNIVEFLLRLGRREEAQQLLQPVLDGSLTCHDQPWSVLCILIHDALDRGDVADAKNYAQFLSRKKLGKKSDLPCAGALLRLYSYDDCAQSLALLEQGLDWSIGLWDQLLLFDFYRGAQRFCARLSRQTPTIPLSLPKKFACWQADGLYDSAALAQWLNQQAVEIAQKFDRRNGNDRFSVQIAHAAFSEEADSNRPQGCSTKGEE